jgi:hypothetical protein
VNIGKYLIQRMNDGRWFVEWADGTGYRPHVIIDDLEAVFDNMMKIPHENRKDDFIKLFRLAMTNHDKFFENPMSHEILKHLPPSTYLPGYYHTPRARFRWHLDQFIQGYASLTGCQLSPTEVEESLQDLIGDF